MIYYYINIISSSSSSSFSHVVVVVVFSIPFFFCYLCVFAWLLAYIVYSVIHYRV